MTSPVTDMKLSIVTTLYKSSKHIEEFHERATKSAQQEVGDSYEIIFVNDGSPGTDLEIATTIQAKDSHVSVIDLSRNFGHHKAMMTGLNHSKGDVTFLLDVDLEEEPELLREFASQMAVDKCDVVFGVQKYRKGGLVERFSGWLFYTLFNILTGYDFPRNIVTARLMKRHYLDALLLHGERELSIGGLFYITGFNQRPCKITKHDTSDSTYTLSRKLSVLVNSVASFSSKPLVGIFFLGIAILVLAIIVSFYFLGNALLFASPPTGWTSLMISVWALGGIIISCVGIVGIYISKIYEESKQRPYTIIRQIYESKLSNSQ